MRHFYLIFSLLCILALTACGSEEELTPPAFSNIKVNGVTDLSLPFKDANVTITGNVDDFAATIVADSTASGKVPVVVESDGRWSFTFAPQEGANLVSLTATDERGNINQMILTVTHDTTPPTITSVVQSVADPEKPQLIVTFDEALLESSLTTVLFRVVNAVDDTAVADSLTGTLTQATVTLPLIAELPAGSYRLICPAVTDLAGNSVATGSFDFTIQ